MTQQEFENRVNMVVTVEEYAHIDAVYMACDASKDVFCDAWAKLNVSRIKAYKETQKAEFERVNGVKVDRAIEQLRDIAIEYSSPFVVSDMDVEIADIRSTFEYMAKEILNRTGSAFDFVHRLYIRDNGVESTRARAEEMGGFREVVSFIFIAETGRVKVQRVKVA